ncbi:MAG: ABC transporter permease [Bacteroidales bacterium]|jgi:putative ABC transport system permease protein|nr:ABC transporter permease [Bacteroidales bacterium]MCU0459653.1 ABC transporter permease [Bacteroidales bacterium]
MIASAYRFIRYDKVKSLGVIIGIVVSVFLIGQQIGILRFLTGLMGGLVGNSRQEIGQIWVVDNITRNANELPKLDESLVRELRSVRGVKNTYPIVASGASVKFPNGKLAPVLVIGSEAPLFVAGPKPETIIEGNILSLNDDESVSAEYYDQTQFDFPVSTGTRVEINGKSAEIKVQTKNARGFAGSFFYTNLSKARYYTSFPESKVSTIAVEVEPGYAVDDVVDNINRSVYGIRAWSAESLRKTTISYITVSSNIGTSIGSLVVFAVISGFFIIGLTLYSSAVDRMKDYGTLKAIGANNWYITRLIVTQSFMFAVTGFLIAMLLLEGFRAGVTGAGLVIKYTFTEYAMLFLVTVFISVGSSLFFSVRTIRNVEPAAVFRT